MRERIVKTTILLRRGTVAEFTEHNPLLRYGEPAFAVDIQRLKIGDGINHWIDLPYIGGEDTVVHAVATESDLPQQGVVGNIYYIVADNNMVSWDADTASYVTVMKSQFEEVLNSVHISKLLQDNDEHIVFDCGTSTTNVW